ncbi:hypothetical protein J8L70_08695 [Pseudoalteromonas sp. MMG010]|uniref:hypothetical protein n=1 Tax=Pseudoalteromonas sp. MMG010 TaxID=2822685 RepID=UPI001B39F408|nr:hypothetical protein [Pseudoalteromonas sp. MMG010]MBQ4833316.1 hypothetical protein [Pseudoalteromonas sp. MMG010]
MSDKNSQFNLSLNLGEAVLNSYEKPIAYAPSVQLPNNNQVVPQHFLRYDHTLDSVKKILENIDFSTHFRVLAAQKNNEIYIQVAVLSPDNYQTSNAKKLLFGRRWLVEKELPTSELIQTAFLALKIAREHEVRELFQFCHSKGSSTPFNNHHDLPLMAQNPELITADTPQDNITDFITKTRFNGEKIKLQQRQVLTNEQCLYTILLTCDDCQLEDFNNKSLSFLSAVSCTNQFMHDLIAALINESNDFVNENFKYLGLARFSKNISAEKIGELSIAMRSTEAVDLCVLGKQHANQLNFEIDSGRAPDGCGQVIGHFLAAHGIEQPENAHLYTNRF